MTESVCAKHAQIGRRIFNTHLRYEMMPKSHPDTLHLYGAAPAGRMHLILHHLSHQAEDDGGFVGSLDEFIREWTGVPRSTAAGPRI